MADKKRPPHPHGPGPSVFPPSGGRPTRHWPTYPMTPLWNDTEPVIGVRPWEECCDGQDECVCVTSGDVDAWYNVYDTVANNSAYWESTYDTVQNTSGDFCSVYDTVVAHSAAWNEAYDKANDLDSSADKWNQAYEVVDSSSGHWDHIAETVEQNSAAWTKDAFRLQYVENLNYYNYSAYDEPGVIYYNYNKEY